MKVISIDGCDYSGKSRLVGIIADKAKEAGWDVTVQSFPSNVNFGAKARRALASGSFPSVVAHLIENDFREHSSAILEANEGKDDKTLVIFDRYVISTYSHQNHTIDLSFGEYIIPDLQILLTLDYETMLVRAKERGGVDWDALETNKYKSPLSWLSLNTRYTDGLEHYKRHFANTLEATGVDDKYDLADEALETIGVI